MFPRDTRGVDAACDAELLTIRTGFASTETLKRAVERIIGVRVAEHPSRTIDKRRAPAGTVISGWQFVANITGNATPGSNTITRTTGTDSTTWAGELVAGGVASVSVDAYTISAAVDVAPRPWFSPAKQATERPPGYQVIDPVTNAVLETITTTDPGTGGEGVGRTVVSLRAIVTSGQIATIAGEGPNQGLKYLTTSREVTSRKPRPATIDRTKRKRRSSRG